MYKHGSQIAFAQGTRTRASLGFSSRREFPLRTLTSMTRPGKAALDAMVEEATIDCHDEEDQLTGLATMIEEYLEVPFATRVLGLAVTVTGICRTSHGLVADCVHGQHRQAIHVLNLPMPEPPVTTT